MPIQISTKPHLHDDKTINQIELSLSYSEYRRECSYSVAAYEHKVSSEGLSWQSGTTDMNGYGCWEGGWQRNNSRRVAKYEADARQQIAARSGRAWEIVSRFADKHGLEILSSAP